MDIGMHHNDRGIVLAGVLIILVAVTLAAVTVARRNTMDEMMAANQRDALNALSISDSGIEAGFSLVKQNYVQSQDLLEDDLTNLPNDILIQDSVSGGNYLVTVIDGVADDGIVTLNSLSDYNGSVREIEVMLEMRNLGGGAIAILTNDDIVMSGEANISGPDADIHSNANISISGNPTLSGTVSAEGTVSISGTPDIEGGTVSGAANVEIPHVYPPEYLQYANVILTADCKVTSASGTVWADASDNNWHGWACAPGDKWTMNDSTPADGIYSGFYYVHGNVILSGSPLTQWGLSVVAEGYIEVSGIAAYQPWGSLMPNDTGDVVANEILFLAGNDLKINGNPSQEFNGILAAHMDVGFSGNPQLNGSILAENGLHHMGQEVTTGQLEKNIVDFNNFNGNMIMVASGNGLGGVKKLAATAWRELVH